MSSRRTGASSSTRRGRIRRAGLQRCCAAGSLDVRTSPHPSFCVFLRRHVCFECIELHRETPKDVVDVRRVSHYVLRRRPAWGRPPKGLRRSLVNKSELIDAIAEKLGGRATAAVAVEAIL